ncbi:MAG TPA: hypothetical protein VLF91_02245 [Candidatus Saccharimonadales bacterium]|nr:hypothetical protein [Candidatus Saccharimonadales bacterium]
MESNAALAIYFLRIFGARCDNTLPASFFVGLGEPGLLSVLEASLAIGALVLRCFAITLSFLLLPMFLPSGNLLGFGFSATSQS